MPPDDLVREIRNRLNTAPESFARGRGRGRGAGPRPPPRRPPRPDGPPPPRMGGLAARRVSRRVSFSSRARRSGSSWPCRGRRSDNWVRHSRSSEYCSSGLATVAAVLIFRPVRGRLRSLEDAARQVGAGDLTARAREDGGDEVAALAQAFNQMTHDLQRAAELQAADRTRRLSQTCRTS